MAAVVYLVYDLENVWVLNENKNDGNCRVGFKMILFCYKKLCMTKNISLMFLDSNFVLIYLHII